MTKLQCQFDGSELKPKDNGKTPVGLFECPKCKSLFRMVVITNNFDKFKNKKDK